MSDSAKHIPTVEGSAKSWAAFDGTGTVAITDSLNVTSLTDVTIGQYSITFTNDMANANFGTPTDAGDNTAAVGNRVPGTAGRTTSTSLVHVRDQNNAFVDTPAVTLAALGELS